MSNLLVLATKYCHTPIKLPRNFGLNAELGYTAAHQYFEPIVILDNFRDKLIGNSAIYPDTSPKQKKPPIKSGLSFAMLANLVMQFYIARQNADVF